MFVISCSLWTVLKIVGPLLNVIPAIAVMFYLNDDNALRRGTAPILAVILYVGLGFIMFGSIKAARAAEIVQVDNSCSQP